MARQRNPLTGELMIEGISAVTSERTGAVTFRARVNYTDGAGKRRFRGKTFKRYDAAEDWKLKTELRLRGGTYRDDIITVADYWDEWIVRKARKLKAVTIAVYQGAWDIHFRDRIGTMPIAQVTRRHLQRIIEELGEADGDRRALRPGTLRTIYAPISSMFTTALHDELIDRHPAIGLEFPPRDTRIPHPWTSLQMQRFLAGVASDDLYPLWMLLAHTGCRTGEARALRVSDVRLGEDPAIWFHRTDRRHGSDEGTKTSRTGRTVSIERPLADALAPLLEGRSDTSHVFTHPDGNAWRHDQIATRLQAHIERLNLPRLTLHEIRHTAATQMVINSVPDATIKSMLGHKSIVTTINTYTHLSTTNQRAGSSTLARLYGTSEATDTTTSTPEVAEK